MSSDKTSTTKRLKRPFRRKVLEWLFYKNLPIFLLLLAGFTASNLDAFFRQQRTFYRAMAKSIVSELNDTHISNQLDINYHAEEICNHWKAGYPGVKFAVFSNGEQVFLDKDIETLVSDYPLSQMKRRSKLNLIRITSSGNSIDDLLKHWTFLFRYQDRKADTVYIVLTSDYELFERTLDLFLLTLLLFTPIILWSGYYISRKVISPLEAISTGVAEFSGGNYQSQISELGTGDEFQQLADELNNTFNIVESNIVQLERFSATAAHEMRTPLTAIIGNLEVALMGKQSEADYREAISCALTEAQNMRQMVAQLLSIAKPSNGDSLQASLFCPEALIGEVLKLMTAATPERTITYRADHMVASIWGNRALVRDLLINILENAIKFSDDSVEIRTSNDDSMFVVQVTDSGIGMSSETQEKIFERFFQGDISKSGIGMGLSISRWIVEAHGGEITIESELEKGTTVSVRLPLVNK